MKEFLRKVIINDDIGRPVLFPVSDSAGKMINKLQNGEVVFCETKEARNYQQLKLWWKMCDLVANNARRQGFEECDTKEKVNEYVKLKLGMVEYRLVITDSNGNSHVHLKTKSISYAKMSQDQWKEFLSAGLLELEKISMATAQQIQDNAHNYETEISDDK